MIEDTSSMDRRVVKGLNRGRLMAFGVILLLLAAGGAYLYPSLSRWASADRSVDMTRLRFGQAVRGDLLRDVSLQGKIVAADHPTLVSPAQGIVSVLVRAGDVVKRGDVMARIESPELENQLKQEQATRLSLRSELERQKISGHQRHLQNLQEVSLLEVQLKAGERAMERARSLFEQGLGSAMDYEKAQDEVQIVQLELDHARQTTQLEKETLEFDLQNRELQLQRQQLVAGDLERKIESLSVASPVSGLVSRVDIRDKDTVQPNQTLFSVVDLSVFQIEVLIPENFADEIAPGTETIVHYNGREYPGQVKSISPEVEASQFKGVVMFTGEAPSGLKQNQRVNMRLVLDSRPGVIKVPRGPFLENMGGRQVYVVGDGMARLRSISVGAVSVTEVEVTSGLEEREQIILSDLSQFEGVQTILLRR